MIEDTISKMNQLVHDLQTAIHTDIDDIHESRHEKLLERNDKKEAMMNEIATLKQDLNKHLVQAMKNGEDLNIYREKINNLELELKKLYELNGRLASMVLPIQKMYQDIVSELTELNGGNLVEIKA